MNGRPATALKLRRIQRGLTQFELCKRAKRPSPGRYSMLERDLVRPRPDEVEHLAHVLDAAPADLFPETAA